MNFLDYIDQFSFKKLFSVSILFGILLILPVSVWLVGQQTRLPGKAAQETPRPTPLSTYGSLPVQPPIIFRVWPFLGKVGDAVVIFGQNFGDNPPKKALFFAGRAVSDDEIVEWNNSQIQFLIPVGAGSGGLVLRVGNFETSFDQPLTLYNQETRTKVYYFGGNLMVSEVRDLKRVAIWFAGEEKREIDFPAPVSVGVMGAVIAEGRKVDWLVLEDSSGKMIPFFVDPTRFGF